MGKFIGKLNNNKNNGNLGIIIISIHISIVCSQDVL